jgi:hypothetical protein
MYLGVVKLSGFLQQACIMNLLPPTEPIGMSPTLSGPDSVAWLTLSPSH